MADVASRAGCGARIVDYIRVFLKKKKESKNSVRTQKGIQWVLSVLVSEIS